METLKRLGSLAEVRAFLAQMPLPAGADALRGVYARWSRGIRRDVATGRSRNWAAGGLEPGLSACALTGEMEEWLLLHQALHFGGCPREARRHGYLVRATRAQAHSAWAIGAWAPACDADGHAAIEAEGLAVVAIISPRAAAEWHMLTRGAWGLPCAERTAEIGRRLGAA